MGFVKLPKLIYFFIKKLMPLSCVDIVLMDKNSRFLLLKRTNDPAKNEWWFPGGRVFFGENRDKAALRKLKEECGITKEFVSICREIGTYEVIFKKEKSISSHAITTIFFITLKSTPNVKLDQQSEAFEWLSFSDWKKKTLNKFIVNTLELTEEKQNGL